MFSSFSSGKRQREDGQISRDDFDRLSEKPSSSFAGTFTAASPGVLSSRKVVRPKRANKSSELFRHIEALNRSFAAFVDQQSQKSASKDWAAAVKDYLLYAEQLQRRYNPQRGELLTFGSGDCGQLAHGVEEDNDLMVKYPRPVRSLSTKQVCRVSCGGLHNAAVTEAGEVFTWGCNDDGALGRTGEENLPAIVEGFPSGTIIVDVVAGDSHTLALSVTGDLFGWGCYKDKDGKGWFHADTAKKSFKAKQTTPLLVQGVEDVAAISCGTCFNLVRCSDGSAWSFGLGEMGQLGRPVCKDLKDSSGEYKVEEIFQEHLRPAPVLIDGDTAAGVKVVGCGAYHSLLSITTTGKTYATGLNNYGQLGVGDTENRWRFSEISDLTGVLMKEMDGGVHHSLCLSVNGEVFSFGRADSGQLGIDDPSLNSTGAFKERPSKVVVKGLSPTSRAVSISCGANHNLLLTSENAVYSWGYGDMLALGNGKEKDELLPTEIQWAKTKFGEAKILQVEGGGQHSAILAVEKGSKSSTTFM